MHLPHDTPTLQLMAYVALTLSSIVVATTSLFIAYRQNFGWNPIIFPSSYGGGGGKYGYTASIDFEVWNRKKYPIAIRRVSVEYEKHIITLVVHTRNTLYLETMPKAERRANCLKFWRRLPGSR